MNAEVLRWLYEAITQHDPRQCQFPFCLSTLAVVRTLLKRKFGVELKRSAAFGRNQR